MHAVSWGHSGTNVIRGLTSPANTGSIFSTVELTATLVDNWDLYMDTDTFQGHARPPWKEK